MTPAAWRARKAASAPAAAVIPPGVAVETCVAEANGRQVRVRLYRPPMDAPQPAVLYMHGGGWVGDGLDSHDGICADLALAAGCTVVSVEYSLAPEAPYPAALRDCEAAADWLIGAAPGLGLSSDRIAVAGDSAGANLAAALCLRLRDRGDARAFRLQALAYPPLDLDFERESYRRNRDAPVLCREMMMWCWHHYLEGRLDRDDPLVAPLKAPDLRGLPGAFIVTAAHDPLLDDGAAYARRLAAAGVAVEYRCAGALPHGFMRMRAASRHASREFNAMAAAIAKAFTSKTELL